MNDLIGFLLFELSKIGLINDFARQIIDKSDSVFAYGADGQKDALSLIRVYENHF